MVTYIKSCNPNTSNDGYVAYVPFELPVDNFVPCNKMVKMDLEYEFYYDKEYKEYQISKIQDLYSNIFIKHSSIVSCELYVGTMIDTL